MPIYEYRCECCGKEFEEWQKFSDPPVEKCSSCGGRTRRLISQSSFVLKGTGWYVTDYGKGSSACSTKPPEKAKTESSSNNTGSSSGTSSDS